MKKPNISILIAGLFFFSAAVVTPAYANTSAADFLVDVGIAHLEAGEEDRGIHELSKALLLNPNHALAKKHLAKLGLPDGLYKGMKTRLSKPAMKVQNEPKEQIVSAPTAEQIKADTEKMMTLEKANQELMAKLKAIEEEKGSLSKSITSKDEMVKSLEEKIAALDKEFAKNDNQKNARIQELETMKAKRVYDLVMAQEQLKALKARHNALTQEGLTWAEQTQRLNQEYFLQRADATEYKKAHNDMLQTMEGYLYVRNNELKTLGDKVVTKELDITHTQNTLVNKMNQLARLEQEANALRRQINEQTKILEDRNKDIEFLKDQSLR